MPAKKSRSQAMEGDKVRILTKKENVEGVLMPSSSKDVIMLKLDNGYNIGFPKGDVKRIDLLEKCKSLQKVPSRLPMKKNLPTIAILHTGGTIASKVDYRTGGVASEFSPEELVGLFPELKEIANVKSELISQMWSDDLRFKHFSLIAEKIDEYVHKGVQGIIIGMGTDNLAVASAALSFIVEESPVPILFVGAQRSSDRGSSDAGMNLICAAEFIAKSDFGGVGVCMHNYSDDKECVILPGCKTYKLHSSRRDAFQAVNIDAIATVNYSSGKIKYVRKDYLKKSKNLKVKPKLEENVGLLKIHVNMFPEQFDLFQGYKGLIIEGTGLGHTPGQSPNPETLIHKKMYPALKRVIDSGCIVVMTTQCIYGGVNMNVYDKGRDLLGLGVMSGKDMLGNTALVKLSWLLANYPKSEVEKLLGYDLRGEINEKIGYESEFVKSDG